MSISEMLANLIGIIIFWPVMVAQYIGVGQDVIFVAFIINLVWVGFLASILAGVAHAIINDY